MGFYLETLLLREYTLHYTLLPYPPSDSSLGVQTVEPCFQATVGPSLQTSKKSRLGSSTVIALLSSTDSGGSGSNSPLFPFPTFEAGHIALGVATRHGIGHVVHSGYFEAVYRIEVKNETNGLINPSDPPGSRPTPSKGFIVGIGSPPLLYPTVTRYPR